MLQLIRLLRQLLQYRDWSCCWWQHSWLLSPDAGVTHALLFSPLWPSSVSWSSITFCWEMYTGNPSLVISVLISKPSEVRGALSLSAICRAHQLAVLAFLHSVVSSPILAARASTSTTQYQVLVRVSNSLKINSNILLTCKKRKKMKL